jgi:hypothetical protein
MTIRQSRHALNQLAVAVSDGANDVVVNDYFYDLPAAQSVLNDIIEIGILPAYHTVSDVVLVTDDLDTNGTPTISLDVGLMSGSVGSTDPARTCGNELFAADTTARTGGTARASKSSAFTILATEQDRSIGVKIAAAAATAAATGRVRLRVWIHAADHKLQF